MSQLELIDIIKNQVYVDTADYGVDERVVRNIISQLRRQGVIFVATHKGKGTYIRIDHATHEQRSKFEHAEMKRWKSEYFSNILPIKNYMSDMRNILLMGVLEGVME